jgi:hypothetical protein
MRLRAGKAVFELGVSTSTFFLLFPYFTVGPAVYQVEELNAQMNKEQVQFVINLQTHIGPGCKNQK